MARESFRGVLSDIVPIFTMPKECFRFVDAVFLVTSIMFAVTILWQVARVLHLIYRLVVQPNTTKAAVFADTFLANGGVEMLLTLLRREAELGEGLSNTATDATDPESKKPGSNDDEQVTNGQEELIEEVPSRSNVDSEGNKLTEESGELANLKSTGTSDEPRGIREDDLQLPLPTKTVVSVARSRSFAYKAPAAGTLGGISSSISADSVRNKFRNMDCSDGIMVGIVTLLGALISGGHLKVMSFGMAVSQPPSSSAGAGVTFLGEGSTGVAATAVVWLLFALEKAFQSAPKKLMTVNVYAALLPAVIRSEVRTLSNLHQISRCNLGRVNTRVFIELDATFLCPRCRNS